MGVLKAIGQLQLDDTFAFAPVVPPEDAQAIELLPHMVCTAIMPVSAQAVKRRANQLRGDQYSVYFRPVLGGDVQAKRVPWDAKVYVYAPRPA